MRKTDPRVAAKEIYEARYKEAQVVLLAGSTSNGTQTENSDLDLVVVYDVITNAFRESFLYREWPVEVFVNDMQSLRYFFERVDGPSGRPVLPQMVYEGTIR